MNTGNQQAAPLLFPVPGVWRTAHSDGGFSPRSEVRVPETASWPPGKMPGAALCCAGFAE